MAASDIKLLRASLPTRTAIQTNVTRAMSKPVKGLTVTDSASANLLAMINENTNTLKLCFDKSLDHQAFQTEVCNGKQTRQSQFLSAEARKGE